jgi:hypothetical protein
MKSKALTFTCLLAVASVGGDDGVVAREPGPPVPYASVGVFGGAVSLRIDWKGSGRDADSGQTLDIPQRDHRRKTYVFVNLRSGSANLWRSGLDRMLKTEGVEPEWLHTEKVKGAKLIRAYFPSDRTSEYYFREGMPSKGRGYSLDVAYYIASCSPPLAFEKPAIRCGTQLDMDSHHVEIKFDRAFLWDFDRLSSEAIAAARYYIAKNGSRR